jgi:hypothetical protein
MRNKCVRSVRYFDKLAYAALSFSVDIKRENPTVIIYFLPQTSYFRQGKKSSIIL